MVVCVCAQLCLSLCDPMTVACQAPLSVEFPRHKNWNGLPFPISGGLPHPGNELESLGLLHWQLDSLPLHHTESHVMVMGCFTS